MEHSDAHEVQFNSTFHRIETLLEINRHQDAEILVREKLAEEPDDAYLHFLLARVQAGQEKFDDAELSLKHSLQCDPEFTWSYYLLSNVSHALLKFTQELTCAKKAAELAPEEPVFLQRLGEAHLQNGEIKRAKEALTQVVKLAPDSEAAFRLLGDIEFDLSNYENAEKYYREALTFDPEDVSLLNDLARSLMAQKKKLRDAIDVLFNIIQLDPTNKVISKNLYIAIQEWIDKNSFRGKGKSALNQLPMPLQYFYNDYKGRSSIFESFGRFSWTFIWIGMFVALIAFFSMIDK